MGTILTTGRVRELIDYHPSTGDFFWKVNRGRGRRGAAAGFSHPLGYLVIRIDGRNYLAHRLAWLIAFGEWPSADIDHINGVPSDNRLENLRLCTPSENQQNAKTRADNKLGVRGVHFHKKMKRFAATIYANGQRTNLGYFDTVEEAKHAYLQAKRSAHPFQPTPRDS